MAYAEATELFRILQVRNASADQTTAAERVLETATREIDSEIDLGAEDVLEPEELELAANVCLRRAHELWMLQEVPLGLAGIGSEFGPAHLSRNSWEKHAFDLAPLKRQWGLA